MAGFFGRLRWLHNGFFYGLQALTEYWLLGLAARLVFASTLLHSFWDMALRRVLVADYSVEAYVADAPGRLIPRDAMDYLTIEASAYRAAGLDPAAPELLPMLALHLETGAAFLLPALIAAGLFTRLASLGMMLFIALIVWAQIAQAPELWNLDLMFDPVADAPIMDQRLLQLFPLFYLMVRGAGAISFDFLLARRRGVAP